MALDFNISLRVNEGAAEKLHVKLPDDEARCLWLYIEALDRLAATRMGVGCQIKVSYTFTPDGFTATAQLPPPDDVDAFIHRLRPFVLTREVASFNRVCGILARAIPHRGMSAMLRRQRDEFEGRVFQSQLLLQSNGTIVNSEAMLQNWLNAYEYHRDVGRRDELAKVHNEMLPLDALRPMFISMLIDKARAVDEIGEIVRLILGQRKGREIGFGGLSIPAAERRP